MIYHHDEVTDDSSGCCAATRQGWTNVDSAAETGCRVAVLAVKREVEDCGANESFFRARMVGHGVKISSNAGPCSSRYQLSSLRRPLGPPYKVGSLPSLRPLAGHRLDEFGTAR